MKPSDLFAPMSRRRKIGYAIAALLVLGTAAFLLGGMDGGFSAWQLFRTACIVAIPGSLILALIAWLSGGKKSEIGFGPANLKVPVRLRKALPYIVAIIVLDYLIQAIGLFHSR
jgi:hypothetical protein